MSCNIIDVFHLNKMSEAVLDPGNPYLPYTAFQPLNVTHFIIMAINLVNHILIIGLTLAMAYRCWLLDFKKTAMHAHLCTLGFVCLMAEGMMARYYGNIIFNKYLPPSKTAVHSILQFVGGSLGIGGTIQKYWGKEKHFKSIHAKLGLVACILCAINFVAGFCNLFLPNTIWGVTILHGFLGLATFITGMLAQFYGYDTGFFRRNFTYTNLYKFVTIAILALSAIGPFKILVYKINQINLGVNNA